MPWQWLALARQCVIISCVLVSLVAESIPESESTASPVIVDLRVLRPLFLIHLEVFLEVFLDLGDEI